MELVILQGIYKGKKPDRSNDLERTNHSIEGTHLEAGMIVQGLGYLYCVQSTEFDA